MADNELDLRRQMDRAARAKALMDDPLLVEAFASVEADLTSLWRNSQSGEAAGRERVWHMIWAKDRLRDFLSQAVTNGKVAQASLDMILKRNKGKAA